MYVISKSMNECIKVTMLVNNRCLCNRRVVSVEYENRVEDATKFKTEKEAEHYLHQLRTDKRVKWRNPDILCGAVDKANGFVGLDYAQQLSVTKVV